MAEVSVTFLEVPEVGKAAKLQSQGRVEYSPVATYVQSHAGDPVVYRVIVDGGTIYMGPLDTTGGTPVQSGYSPSVQSGSFASQVMEAIPAPKLIITIAALAILIFVISKVYPLVVPGKVDLVEWEYSGAKVTGTVKNNTRKIQKDVTVLFNVRYDYHEANRELGTLSVSSDFLAPGEEWEFNVELEGSIPQGSSQGFGREIDTSSPFRTEWLAADFKEITATPIEGDMTLPAVQVVTHKLKIKDKNTLMEQCGTIESRRSVSR